MEYNDELCYCFKAVTKLPDAITPDIQQATTICLRSKEISLVLQEV